MNIIRIFSALFVLISFSSMAQTRGGKFSVTIAAKGGLGTAASKSEDTIESRDLYRMGGELALGYNIGPFLLGAAAEYILWNQKTDPDDVDGINMSGKQLNVSPMVAVAFGKLMLSLRSPLYSRFTVEKSNSADQEVILFGPEVPAYGIQLNYRLEGRSYVGIEYTSTTYKKSELDGEEAKLGDDDLTTFSGWGLVYGYLF